MIRAIRRAGIYAIIYVAAWVCIGAGFQAWMMWPR